MTNSPVPSSSKTPEPETGQKKKKIRTRRRTRKPKKKIEEDFEGKCLGLPVQKSEFVINFVIGAVKDNSGIFYRTRNQTFSHINVQSFIKDKIPCFFLTKSACDSSSRSDLVQRIQKLSFLNGIRAPENVQSSPSHIKTDQRKNETKKKLVFFHNYMAVEQVKLGLEKGDLMKGFIRVNPKNCKESYVGNVDVAQSDYIINSVLDRNRALDGDEVVLKLKTVTEDKKKLMEVVYITQKIHPRTGVGFLEPLEKDNEYALFLPRDRRIPRMKIPRISWPSGFHTNPKLYEDILFDAKITEWKEPKFALGMIVETLGRRGDLKVESLAILKDLCLDPTPFGDEIKRFLPKSCEIPRKESESREDLRKECLFTIDPITARDLDDAVSCKQLPNDNFEVGVHISDVSFYLSENTILDEQVRKKATTIYMVDSVYHMLPVELCLHCSLLPGEDKLAFSVFFEMTADGEIVNKRIARTVINSCCQLAYEHAQLMIDSPDNFDRSTLPVIHHGYRPEDLSLVVNNLEKIAVNLRQKRKRNGALKIDQVKIGFSLDPQTGLPTNFWVCESKPAHKLIEEFMLLANIAVAEFVHQAFPDLAFLRLHESPKPWMMTELQKNLETIGIHIDISSPGGIQASLDKYQSEDLPGECRMAVLNHLLAKPMKRAKYFCSGAVENTDFSHYALSIPIYTHFTSPIRRYADIMTHRLLAASLNYCEKPSWIAEEVAIIAETCNRQKYQAKKAGEASSDLYLAHYVQEHRPFFQNGVVIDAKERSVDVIILKTGTVVRIYKNNCGENISWIAEEIRCLNNDTEENSNNRKLWRIAVKFPQTRTETEICVVLEMFTLVSVELTRKPKTNKLEAKLLRPSGILLSR